MRSRNPPIIDDSTPVDKLFRPIIDGKRKGRGLVERDYNMYPETMFAPPTEMALIPRSEWSERIKEGNRTKSFLSHKRGTMPSLDQGSNGYCWGHSVTHTVQMVRQINNLPDVPLSAYMVCAIIKKGRNEGGWCGLAAEFIRAHGICSQKLWPQGNRSTRLDTTEVREEAAKYKITEDWVDLTRNVYDQNLTFDQVATCLLLRIPVAVDFNWWSHSVCALDLVEVEPGSFGIMILNSWSDRWGDRGTGILQGNRAIPDGAVATRAVLAA